MAARESELQAELAAVKAKAAEAVKTAEETVREAEMRAEVAEARAQATEAERTAEARVEAAEAKAKAAEAEAAAAVTVREARAEAAEAKAQVTEVAEAAAEARAEAADAKAQVEEMAVAAAVWKAEATKTAEAAASVANGGEEAPDARLSEVLEAMRNERREWEATVGQQMMSALEVARGLKQTTSQADTQLSAGLEAVQAAAAAAEAARAEAEAAAQTAANEKVRAAEAVATATELLVAGQRRIADAKQAARETADGRRPTSKKSRTAVRPKEKEAATKKLVTRVDQWGGSWRDSPEWSPVAPPDPTNDEQVQGWVRPVAGAGRWLQDRRESDRPAWSVERKGKGDGRRAPD
jgi:hypothetical protein